MSDPLEDLEEAAELLPAAAAGVRLGDKAKDRLQRFSDVARQERRLKAYVELGRILDGRADAQVKALVDRALAAAREASDAMEEADDEATLEEAVLEYLSFTQALSSLEATLRPLWTRVVDQQFTPLGSAGRLLEAFPGARDLGGRMIGAATAAQQTAQTPVVELPTIVADLLERRSALVEEQQTVAGDPKVAGFLQALADDRATLDLLLPEVLKWLGDQGALTSLKISAA
jgi:hypothetical protein